MFGRGKVKPLTVTWTEPTTLEKLAALRRHRLEYEKNEIITGHF